MSRPTFEIREGGPQDIDAIITFIYEHGDNGLNYLETVETHGQVKGIETGATQAILVNHKSLLVGVVTYAIEHTQYDFSPIVLPEGPIGHVQEVVVHKDYVGRKMGGALISRAVVDMMKQGVVGVFASHHADNAASARIMEKNGMKEIARFDDPLRRTFGTPQTVIRTIFAANKTLK